MDHLPIKEMPESERPYEKCELFGASYLTDAELLAVILRSGTKGQNTLDIARRILYPDASEGETAHLQSRTKEELLKIPGIGRVKAMQILCLCELSKRLSKRSAASELDFSMPETIANYYMEEMRHLKKEHMKLLMLNTRTRLIGESELSKGTVNMSVVSPRELFIEALQKNAVYVIMIHNHPSGDPTPSEEDILITRRVAEAGRLIGIELLDHIIIGDNRYYSVTEAGIVL